MGAIRHLKGFDRAINASYMEQARACVGDIIDWQSQAHCDCVGPREAMTTCKDDEQRAMEWLEMSCSSASENGHCDIGANADPWIAEMMRRYCCKRCNIGDGSEAESCVGVDFHNELCVSTTKTSALDASTAGSISFSVAGLILWAIRSTI
eukprot:gnl/TRDRNA2_/TRDRNA2_137733_c0_seq2.p1 gnl/TRDRNA2_/TRDRNA2_137733_c0~~gnl/TRDRNA2_/TRDRNA2_137733_c0_seq2.p1  ORF type:complete len:151 (+),score=16.78 gnl/TRDRNA2_/TRDRNA2_137733_c0_seq2:300-752(+)